MNIKTDMNAKMSTILAILAAGFITNAAQSAGLNLIPRPVATKTKSGQFDLTAETRISVDGVLAEAAGLVAQSLRERTGLPLRLDGKGTIRLVASRRLPAEGYELEVTRGIVTLRASTPTGAFYGGQTLLQLLDSNALPCVTIKDEPRFAWRGLMLDCSRTFQSLDYLRQTVDRMAFYKMNVLHLHLTDDQGWRLEIKRYPELTDKGARFADKWNEPAAHQGFYTQARMKELIRYAAARGITIVPEIEMPGHSLGALACVPELSCTGGPFEIFPFLKGPNMMDHAFCAGNEATFTFLENVLAEVIALFPSRYIHIGGDEVPKDHWKACAKCQARMKAEGLKDELELQSYFICRIEKFVNAQGRTIIGWDEILEGGLAPNAAVMSWRGVRGGIAAARAGHPVVMSPKTHCYFDYSYQAIDTLRAYSYEPVPPELDAAQAKFVLGVQANFWSHIDREPQRVDYQLFPRLLGIAERGWSPKDARDLNEFSRRVTARLANLDRFGVRYRREPVPSLTPAPTIIGVTERGDSIAALGKGPLKVASNGHYLVKSDGTPFFYLGDQEWTLNRHSDADIASILDDRVAKGYTVIQTSATRNWTNCSVDFNGYLPFLNNDVTLFNTNYWNRLTLITDSCAKRGLYLAINVGEPGRMEAPWYAHNTGQCYEYGRKAGETFRGKTNIIFNIGHDMRGTNGVGLTGWRSIAEGVADGYNNENDFNNSADYSTTCMDFHPDGGLPYSSSAYFHADSWLDANGAEVWHNTGAVYGVVNADYIRTGPVKPILLVEGWYEAEDGCTAKMVRVEAWHTFFAGGFYGYGHYYNWHSWNDISYLNSTGAKNMGVLATFMKAREWWKFVPEQGMITSGVGSGATRKAAVKSTDGAECYVYYPEITVASIMMNRITAGNNVVATWFDPRNGNTQSAGTFTTSQTVSFTPPEGWEDAVLRLNAQ